MKKSTLIGVAAVGVAAGAIAARTGLKSNRQTETRSVPSPAEPILEPDVDPQAFLDHLAQAVRIPTVVYADRQRNDPADILAMHDFLKKTYPLIHERCRVEKVNDLSLLFTWEGTDTDADSIVLMAHMDVVPVEPGTEQDWLVGAFEGKTADGELWGRGTLDDKGPLIATMEAVEHLAATDFHPERTIILAIGHDEEIGGAEGASNVAALLNERGVRPWFVIDEGGAVMDSFPPLTAGQVALVKVAEKGYVDIELTATGEGGHSSFPPKTSTIGTLAMAIRQLETHPMPARVDVLRPFFDALGPRLDPRLRPILTNLGVTGPAVSRLLAAKQETDIMMRTTTAVTMVSGGVKPNVLPQEARAVVNFRILPGDSIESVIEHVRDVVGEDIAVRPVGEMRGEPSRFSSVDSSAWQILSTSIEETFPGAVAAPWILTGATDSRYYSDFAEDIYGFSPFTGDMGALSTIHGTGERVRTSDAQTAVSFFCRLIRNAQPSGG